MFTKILLKCKKVSEIAKKTLDKKECKSDRKIIKNYP